MTILSRNYLRAVREKALRKRNWYRVLDRVERGIMDLTIRFVDSVKSRVLARQLVKILVKLRDAAKSAFTRHIESFGVAKLWSIIEQASGFGCDLGHWASMEYAEYLGFTDYYNPGGWRGF